jgi:hypothetical protein
MDLRLHTDRVDGRAKRLHRRAWRDLPDHTFVVVDDAPARVRGAELLPWSSDGYGRPSSRPNNGDATVITPAATVDVLVAGYPLG